MKTYSAYPYFDDFNDEKSFHQILFKAGDAVQARELTQLQTIIRSQIEKFGNHIFKHGSPVIPGNTFSEIGLPTIKLNQMHSGLAIVPSNFEDEVIVGVDTGIEAIVKKMYSRSTDVIAFISYIKANAITGAKVFSDGEEVFLKSNTATGAKLIPTLATSKGSLGYVNEGVFYVNGSFVSVQRQSVVLSDSEELPSCHMLLRIDESITNWESDSTLLDPSQGAYNYDAPGADRVKITLTLVTLPLNTPILNNYIELMRYNEGVLEEHLKYAKYSELEKSLARRTYDESGNYVSTGLRVDVSEHYKTPTNNGIYFPPKGDRDLLAVTIDAGKAYIKGFECEKESRTILPIEKGRTADHILKNPQISLMPSFGQYIFVTGLKGLPEVSQYETVNLYNAISTNGSKVKIGEANVIAIDFHQSAVNDADTVFKLYLSSISMLSGSIHQVGSISYALGSAEVLQRMTIRNSGIDYTSGEVIAFTTLRKAKVHLSKKSTSELYVIKHLHNIEVPNTGESILGESSGATSTVFAKEIIGTLNAVSSILELPFDNVYCLKNPDDIHDISYKSYKKLSLTTTEAGTGSVSVSGMTIDPIEQGNILIVSPTAVQPYSIASISTEGTVLSIVGGPVSEELSIIVSVTKINQIPKTKTFISNHIESGLSVVVSKVQLAKADVYSIVSVVSTTLGDVTNRFILDNGQRDYCYECASLKLIGALPTGTLTVKYNYFQHSGTSDFFSVDSYMASGLTDAYEKSFTYKASNGKIFQLFDCLDFRARQGDNRTMNHATAKTIDLIQPNSRLVTSLQTYMPRIDTVLIHKDASIDIIRGTPSKNPVQLPQRTEDIILAAIYIPPYTRSTDFIDINLYNNKVYTMRSIADLEDRVESIEQYTLLSDAESSIVNLDIVDAESGLSRYKSGYLVENFQDIGRISNLETTEFSVAIDSGYMLPKIEVIDTPITYITGDAHVHEESEVVTLPYIEVIFASQMVSTKMTNINPFGVFSWKGTLLMIPAIDNYIQSVTLATKYEEVKIMIDLPRPPIIPITVDPEVPPHIKGPIIDSRNPRRHKPKIANPKPTPRGVAPLVRPFRSKGASSKGAWHGADWVPGIS